MLAMSAPEVLVMACSCMLAAIVQCVSGFGFAVIMVALLPLLGATIQDAAVGITVLVVPNVAIALWRVRREVRPGRVAWLLAGVPAGTPVGLYLLAFGPEWLLRSILGLVLILAAGEPFLRGDGGPSRESRAWAFVAGVASGALGAALSTGGPPVVLYFYRCRLGKEATKAALMLVFAATVSWRLVVYVAQAPITGKALLTPQLGLMAMAYWPAVVAGTLLGEQAFASLSPAGFRRAVAAMLAGCGVYQLGRAAGAW